MARVLLVYDSRAGLVQQLADALAEGVRSVGELFNVLMGPSSAG